MQQGPRGGNLVFYVRVGRNVREGHVTVTARWDQEILGRLGAIVATRSPLRQRRAFATYEPQRRWIGRAIGVNYQAP